MDRPAKTPWFSQVSVGGFIGFIVAMFFMYFLLLGPEHTFFSLDTVLTYIGHFTSNFRLIAVSLIPIYLSFLIFGGGAIGGMLGHYIQIFLNKWHHHSPH